MESSCFSLGHLLRHDLVVVKAKLLTRCNEAARIL